MDLGQERYLLWGKGGTVIKKGVLYKMEMKDTAILYCFRLEGGGIASLYSHQLKDRMFETLEKAQEAVAIRGYEGNPNVVLRDCVEQGYLYAVRVGDHVKIGITKDPTVRFMEYTKLMYEPEIVCMYPFYDVEMIEAKIHNMFEEHRVRGEWFWLSNGLVIETVSHLWREQSEKQYKR